MSEYKRIPPQNVVPTTTTRFVSAVPEPLTELQKNEYLERVALGRSLHGAAADMKLPYLLIVREQKHNPAFKEDLAIAMAVRGNALLEIALEQCTAGVDEPLTHQGRISYEYPNGYTLDDTGNVTPETERVPVTVKKLVTSNPMLLALLKALFPKQFAERVEVTNPSAPAANTIEGEARRTLEYVERDLLELMKRSQQAADPDEDLL